MAIKRRPRARESAAQVEPGILLWLLRILVPLGGHRELKSSYGFKNESLVEAIGLGHWIDREETESSSFVSALRALHRITTDNGSEFAAHEWLTKQLGVPVYFTDSYASWQKGAVENTNKLIRQYIPKGMDISTVSEQRIASIQAKINRRPRAKLNFNTPKEIMVKVNRSLHPMERAKLDNAQSGAVQNATNIEDLTNALLELGELFAEQDDALVELAELIEEV